MSKAVCIIQARRGSTRLPDKVLLPLGGKSVVDHVLERALAIKCVDEVVLATTNSPSDDVLEEIARKAGASVYRGSEHDVLDRYYQAATKAKATHVMRITADCPLLDPNVCNQLIEKHMYEKADYGGIGNFPHGLDCEFFTMGLLQQAHEKATSKGDREHVTLWMKRREDLIKICVVPEDKINYSDFRWTLDYPEDYEFLKRVFKEYPRGKANTNWKDLCEFLIERPQLQKINNQQALQWALETKEIYKKANL